jgi:hypothetical protein
MKPGELPHISPVQRLLERTVSEEQEKGMYPAMFDESHLQETIDKLVGIIESRHLIHTNRDRAQATRAVCFEIGLYMQAHHLDKQN